MRILEFIKQNCKNVEFRALGEVCEIKRGRVISKDYLSKHQGSYPVYSSQTANDGIFGLIDTYDFDGDYVTWTTDGQYAGTVFYRTGKFNITNVCGLLKNKIDDLNLKFLYYFLALNAVKHVNKGMGNYKLMSNVIANIKIPLPPMVVQERIVEVLDSFTSLERSLEREKLAREKQYKYYLNHLITNARNSRILKLGEVCEIKGRIGFRGYTTADMVKENQGAITLSPRNIINQKIDFSDLQFISWAKYEESPEIMIFENDVVFCKTGSTLGKVAIIENLPQKTTLNPQLVVFKNIKCNNRFLYYVVSTENFQSKAQSLKGVGAVSNISQGNLANIEIPLPPLDEQERIVRILDSLNELANGLSAGIPKEIELRQKQYEYWRDRLLEFPSKDSK